MENIQLRPMSEQEYAAWESEARLSYAAEKEKAGLGPEEARKVSQESFARLLPQGLRSPGQHLYVIHHAATAEDVGILWWASPSKNQPHPWVYDIVIHAPHRGRGLGRAAMEAAEADVRAKGFRRLELHVFGHNEIARSLYESLGFKTLSVVMGKDL
jgi:ribosomal protein S18 acetylase RimI-like enzyme